MKRLTHFVLLSLAAVVMSAQPAGGIPGPETNPPTFFEINVNELLEAPLPHDMYSSTRFLTADGWDFGDRAAYSCAWVEFFEAGAELFEVHYEMVANYPIPIEINDRDGEEAPDPEIASLCGDGSGAGANITHDGSDHFPHGTSLDFFLGGVQVATIDYGLKEPGDCDRGYWTPGDEPGESWLWWDEDGPQDLMPGHPLDCGGGPVEPVPVVRAYVQNMASGVGVCTRDEMDGDMCLGNTPAPEPPPPGGHHDSVTLRLRGQLRASGHVRLADGSTECLTDRVVVIQRRASGDWVKAGRDRTSGTGHYSLQLRPRGGTYRARVLEESLQNGDVCMALTSRRRVYEVG
jgi:hypothetical protein